MLGVYCVAAVYRRKPAYAGKQLHVRCYTPFEIHDLRISYFRYPHFYSLSVHTHNTSSALEALGEALYKFTLTSNMAAWFHARFNDVTAPRV